MLGLNCKKLFKRWRLSENDGIFDTVITYEIPNEVKVERRFNRSDKDRIHNFVFDLYFEYERHEGVSLSAREISYLLWCTHNKVDNILKRINRQWIALIQRGWSEDFSY